MSVFTLLVGDTGIEMFAHQNVLALSPVLGRFCSANFREKDERRIILQDDDPMIFSLLLEFLYSRSIDMHEIPERLPLSIKEKWRFDYITLISLYITAFKYDLGDLQSCIKDRLEDYRMSRKIFWRAAQRIYEYIPFRIDDYYFRYFELAAQRYIVPIASTRRLLDMAEGGGELS